MSLDQGVGKSKSWPDWTQLIQWALIPSTAIALLLAARSESMILLAGALAGFVSAVAWAGVRALVPTRMRRHERAVRDRTSADIVFVSWVMSGRALLMSRHLIPSSLSWSVVSVDQAGLHVWPRDLLSSGPTTIPADAVREVDSKADRRGPLAIAASGKDGATLLVLFPLERRYLEYFQARPRTVVALLSSIRATMSM